MKKIKHFLAFIFVVVFMPVMFAGILLLIDKVLTPVQSNLTHSYVPETFNYSKYSEYGNIQKSTTMSNYFLNITNENVMLVSRIDKNSNENINNEHIVIISDKELKSHKLINKPDLLTISDYFKKIGAEEKTYTLIVSTKEGKILEVFNYDNVKEVYRTNNSVVYSVDNDKNIIVINGETSLKHKEG